MDYEGNDWEEKEEFEHLRDAFKGFVENLFLESLKSWEEASERSENYSLREDIELMRSRRRDGIIRPEHHRNFSDSSREYSEAILLEYNSTIESSYLGRLYRNLLSPEPLKEGLEKSLEVIEAKKEKLSKFLDGLAKISIGKVSGVS